MTEDEKKWECEKVYKGHGEESADDVFWKIAMEDHPGVQMVMARKEFCLAGPVKVLSEGEFPEKFKGVYLTPAETRAIFDERGWANVAAMQLRNPMHRSHEHLCKIALDVCDGVLIHSLIGNLKPGDIPAEVRINCIDTLIKGYFVPEHVVNAGYPLDMRYAGPREALLHATFRQNYGVNKMIIGRDHAGVGDFYTLFEAQEIFDQIPQPEEEGKRLLCEPLKIDWTFYCYKCDGMASMKTCPHTKEDRVILSGTKLRHALSNNEEVVDHFGREEVLVLLREYYAGLKEKVAVKLQSHAEGSKM
jgi:sulfate adenylyltransferase